jgi:hypothetical protein
MLKAERLIMNGRSQLGKSIFITGRGRREIELVAAKPGAAELPGIHSGQAAPAGGDRKDCLRALIKKLSQH